MTAWPPGRTGVLIVRVWFEGSPATGLRARITRLADVSRQEQVIGTASSIEEIERAVTDWLQSLTGT